MSFQKETRHIRTDKWGVFVKLFTFNETTDSTEIIWKKKR